LVNHWQISVKSSRSVDQFMTILNLAHDSNQADFYFFGEFSLKKNTKKKSEFSPLL